MSSSDEDSDVERNYALFTERQGRGEEPEEQQDEEEPEEEEQSDEEEEGESDGTEEDGGSGEIQTSEDVKKGLSFIYLFIYILCQSVVLFSRSPRRH